MIILFIVLFLLFWLCKFDIVFTFKFIPCIFKNIIHIIPSALHDIKSYLHGENRFTDYGYYIFGGSFGSGKTLNMVKKSKSLIKYYKKYYDVVVWSNMELYFTDYNKFEYFEDLERTPEDGQIFIYLIDEAGSIFYSRNYSKSKLNEEDMVLALNQVRKDRKCVLMSSQRHKMLDAALRRVCDSWHDVKKLWRFSFITVYSGYDLEFENPDYIRPIHRYITFATDSDRLAYDTHEHICMLNKERLSFTDNSNDTYVTVSKRRKHRRVV